jgi:hypothetical protein
VTDLTRTIRRKVTTLRGQPLVVALTPEGIWLREPRKRLAYLLPYGTAWQKAAELYGMAEKRRKKDARMLRKARRATP